MLVESGWTITAAGSAISLVLWICVFSIPFGGVMADRTKKPLAIMMLGWVASAILLLSFSHGSNVVVSVVALGLFVGLPAGSIMSLPGHVLRPETRATGMGIFYTAYYVPMMVGPAVGGWFAKYAGQASTALDFGAASFSSMPSDPDVFSSSACPSRSSRFVRNHRLEGALAVKEIDSASVLKFLDDFAAAWNEHDANAILSMMTSDCIMQLSAGPEACGQRFVGQDEVRTGINQVFAATPDVAYNNPKHIITGDRAVTEWLLTGTGPDGPIEVDGCDIFEIRDGKIAVKNSYRKQRVKSLP